MLRLKGDKMNKNIIVLFIILIMLLTLSFVLPSCVDYGYSFLFRVVGGNGEITTEDSDWLTMAELCNNDKYESWPCELDCPEGSQVILTLGNKKSSCAITFLAIPDEGYQVKEWLYNGKVVEGNKTNIYTAIVTSKDNYNGVIEVVFEKIPQNE